jgi:hypothetical protein
VAMKDHLLSVCPCGDMIGGVGHEFSVPAHTGYRGPGRKML